LNKSKNTLRNNPEKNSGNICNLDLASMAEVARQKVDSAVIGDVTLVLVWSLP
jgi:hypothetical protein